MPRPRPIDPAIRDLLLSSPKFLDWKPEPKTEMEPEPGLDESCIMAEKHYTPTELAEMWGVSPQTVRDLFKDEEGVLKIGSDGTKTRRAYKTLRIPHSIAERVHTRLSC
jgi:hypothetical protein